MQGLAQVKLTTAPGIHYAYSNMASELSAYILQQVYAQDYESLLISKVLKPLGMLDTKYTLSARDQLVLVKGYNQDNKLMPNFERTLWGGMAGLHGTLPDLVKYMHWQLDESQHVVKETHQLLYQIEPNLGLAYHWYISDQDTDLALSHHGGIYGMQNWLVIYPQHGTAISIFSNTSFAETGEILGAFVERLFTQLKGNEIAHTQG
jgi:CubicO group peptidase (beta-lactamase class C family)